MRRKIQDGFDQNEECKELTSCICLVGV